VDEIADLVDLRTFKVCGLSFGKFQAIDYIWDGQTKTIYLFDRPGQSPVVFDTEAKMLAAASMAAKPQLEEINARLNRLEASVRNGGDGQEVGLRSWGGTPETRQHFSLSTSTGTSGGMSVEWHRGQISKVDFFGSVAFIWGKVPASLVA
jgi:hypothetical protein